MKYKSSLLAAFITAALSQGVYADSEASADKAMADLLASDAFAPASSGKPADSKAELAALAQTAEFQPPSITEIFNDAQRLKLTQGWSQQIEIDSADYAAMPLPERAFSVGKALADIAFVVLLLPEDQAPSLALVQQAYDGVLSLNPPEEIRDELQVLYQHAKGGELKGVELRNEITRLLNEQIPLLERAEDPQTRDAGVVMVLTGYLRALYLGAQTLTAIENPSKDQLAMVSVLSDTLHHYQQYLAQQLSDLFKDAETIKNLAASLNNLLPYVDKAKISQADVKAISESLSQVSK